MNWIISSILMWLSSVLSYLLLRKSNLLNIPVQLNNFAMFFIPFLVYVLTAIIGNINLIVSLYVLIIILVLSLFFSYLGNIFSLKGMNSAPNPGYSLIISKSYVVMTSVASIFIFDSELTLRKSIAILIILLFSALLTLSKDNGSVTKKNKKDWVWLSMGAFLCWGLLSLTSKYLLTIGVNPISRLVYTMGIASVLSFTEIKVKRVQIKNLRVSQFGLLLLIGILTALLNYCMQISYDLAPNIGYVNAINLSSVAGVALFSSFIYKDELTWSKFVLIIGTTLGLVILVI